MSKTDIHQHLWTEPFRHALEQRRELPFVRNENGLTVLFLAGERPYVIDGPSEGLDRRAALVERDGLDRALLCISSPLGIEWLPREQSIPLIDAYHDGACSLGEPFGAWGAIALDRPDPDDVDRAVERGCIGLSLPAGAIGSVEALSRVRLLLARVELLGVPLLVHPGPAAGNGSRRDHSETSLQDPLWWPALTRYVAQMQAGWFAFITAGRSEHPGLRVIFAMLAGLAPLHAERLRARGGHIHALDDPLLFYDTSSYGATAIGHLADLVGPQQLLYGSDRPVVEPADLGMPDELDWDPIIDATDRALEAGPVTVR